MYFALCWSSGIAIKLLSALECSEAIEDSGVFVAFILVTTIQKTTKKKSLKSKHDYLSLFTILLAISTTHTDKIGQDT